ncbi:hypothetical protein IWQ61_003383 [Dispira simplex]|nr:hypothetical protein IWQ61_003383 [Dispira simplex]
MATLTHSKPQYTSAKVDQDTFVVQSEWPIPTLCPQSDCAQRNFGHLNYVYLLENHADSSANLVASRVLLSFPLPRLRANETYTVCSLAMPRSPEGNEGVIDVKELSGDFDESTVTFTTAPGDGLTYGFFDANIATVVPVLSGCLEAAQLNTYRLNLALVSRAHQYANVTFPSKESGRIPPRLYIEIDSKN